MKEKMKRLSVNKSFESDKIEKLLTRLKKGKEESHTPPISWMKECNTDSTDIVGIKGNIMSHCILINDNTLMKWANSLTDTNY